MTTFSIKNTIAYLFVLIEIKSLIYYKSTLLFNGIMCSLSLATGIHLTRSSPTTEFSVSNILNSNTHFEFSKPKIYSEHCVINVIFIKY